MLNVCYVVNKIDAFLSWFQPICRRRQFRKVVEAFDRRSPGHIVPIDKRIEAEHVELWGKLGKPVNKAWLRLLANISGTPDPRFCPEDLYHSVVERVLNDMRRRDMESEDKNSLDIYVDRAYTPMVCLRYIRDMFMDGDYRFLTETEAHALLAIDHGPLIGKVAVGSLGGYGVTLFEFNEGRYVSSDGIELTVDFIRRAGSYVLQCKVEQCEFTRKFNPSSVNTFRMITLRCPWDGKIVLLKSGFRIGVTSSAVDNLSSGGICVSVDNDGNLAEAAYSFMTMKPYERYLEHPATHIRFKGQCHPDFEKMKATVIALAAKIPYMNILAWDVVSTPDHEVKILEVNSYSISVDWIQYGNGPLFGDYTQRVIDWCRAHRHLGISRAVNF